MDPIGLRVGDPVYMSWFRWFGGDIYDLGHVVVVMLILRVFQGCELYGVNFEVAW